MSCGPTSSWVQSTNSAVRGTGGFQSGVSPRSSYVRAIVRGRASRWFEESWTPLGSFGQAPLMATWSTFALQPMWARRLMRCLDATLQPSARSGDGYYLPQQTCWRSVAAVADLENHGPSVWDLAALVERRATSGPSSGRPHEEGHATRILAAGSTRKCRSPSSPISR